jgi:pSer/pThr/pTyr-binding forkhead associated (FHA) protein
MSIVVFRNLDDGVDFQCVYPGKTTIGRGEHNHWSPPNQRAVSKVHAELEIAGTLENRDFSARLIDLESRNGTFVGIGNPIEWEKVRGSHKLTVGDKIKFGTGGTPYQLLVVNPEQALALVAPRVLHVAAPGSKEDAAPRMATVEEVDENEPFEDDQDSRSLISRSSEGTLNDNFQLCALKIVLLDCLFIRSEEKHDNINTLSYRSSRPTNAARVNTR